MEDDQEERSESLLPYDEWTEEALRAVVVRALGYAAENGLPGDHHFYVTFRTDHPGTVVPPRLRSQYPQEMTIVLQHQFWDLAVDPEAGLFTVGLSFGGIPATLAVPFAAVVGFADPQVRYGLRFQAAETAAASEAEPEQPVPAPATAATAAPDGPDAAEGSPEAQPEAPQVVSLDAFRRRSSQKD